jgi:AAHS family 4-hydroxybenzoate transporter-like MFS transporter
MSQPAARTAEKPVKVAIDEILNARRGSWLQLTVIALMTAVTVLDGLDMQLLPLSAPLILSEWGISKLAFSPAMGGALMGMAVGTVMGGYIGDRFGRRRTLVGAVGFFGLATLACALARTPLELTVLRVISGIGFGASFPSATAVVAEWMPRRWIAKAVGTVFVGVSVGFAIGGQLAIETLPHWGWRGSFACGGILAVMLSLVLTWKLPESPSWLAKRGYPSELIRSLLKRAWPKETFSEATEFIASASTDTASVGSSKILEAENLRVNFGLWLAFFMNMLAGFALSSWSPVILTALGVSVRTALAGSTYYGLATMAGTLGAGLAGSRLGTRSVMVWLSAAAALAALAISTEAFVDLEQLRRAPAVLIAGIAFMGGCIAGLQTLLWVLAANAYSTECRATGVAVAAGIGRVGAIVSSVGAGALLSFLPDGYFFVCMAFAFGLVGLGMSAVDRHLSADRPAGENLPDRSGLAPTTAVTARKV